MPIRYTRVGWQDAPSTETPIDAANLNHMDNGILALSEEMDTELPLIRDQINDVSADIETQIDEKIPPEVSSWLTEHVTPAGSAVVVDDTLTIQGAAADAKKTGDEITSLKEELSVLYDPSGTDDMYGSDAAVVRTDNVLTSAVWDDSTKTVTVSMSGSASSQDTYYVVLQPKFIANHTYKIAIGYTYVTAYAYTTIRNTFSTTNFNSRDDIINGVAKDTNTQEVFTFTATNDGWLALAIMVPANAQRSWSWKLAVYDVTGVDISALSDADFLTFADTIALTASGLVPTVGAKAEYSYAMDGNVKGETWSALGDSLTALGSGSQYLGYVLSKLGLANYHNCGIGGTSVSGATNANAMYQDTRIEALNINSTCVTVMGGTNDFWQQYYKDHPSTNYTGWGDCTRENHDVSTFCGAYNVMLSKILYKFCKVPAYYNDVDYTGITQVSTAVGNFRLILLTPPQAFHVDGDSASAALLQNGITAAHDYVKQIAELWGLPCVDTWEMGMNDMNRSLFFADYLTDATHFNAFGHERLASLIIDKVLQVSRYK